MSTLLVLLGLAAFVSPAVGQAAKLSPTEAGILKVHVTNYQHETPVEGAWITAVSPLMPGQYTATTDRAGIAVLKVPAGIYHVTAQVLPPPLLYEPWSQDVNVTPDAVTVLGARLLYSPEMYPLEFTALDPKALSGVDSATVRVYDLKGQTIAEGVTNAKGVFATKAPKGIFLATVQHGKYAAHTDFVQINSTKMNFNTVALAPLNEPTLGDMQIHVSIQSPGPVVPIDGAAVTLYDASGNKVDQGMSDATGTYYTCLPGGKYLVVVSAPNYNTSTAGYVITTGTLTHYQVLLTWHPVEW